MDIIDLRDTIIPFSLLQLTNRFHRMRIGQTIEIIGIDESVLEDLKSLLPASGCELILSETMSPETISPETISTAPSYFRCRLRKIKTQTIKPKENCHVSHRSEHR